MYQVGKKKFRNQQSAVEYYGNALVWILKRAVELTPVDTGRLINSYKLERYGQGLNQVRIVNDCEYALYVHEMENQHTNGQAKFLEYAGWLAMQVFNNLSVTVELDEEYIALYLDDSSHGVDITGKYDEADELEFETPESDTTVTSSVTITDIADSENKLLSKLNDLDGYGNYNVGDLGWEPLSYEAENVFLKMSLLLLDNWMMLE